MRRRRFLRNIALGTTGLAAGLNPVKNMLRRPDRPNILLILADDMGFSDLGSWGSIIDTPNIDRLANNGVKFSQFYNSARCSPTRASLLTGLYPHQTGVGHLATSHFDAPGYQGYLDQNCVTIGTALKKAGYKTMMTGKWHVGTEKSAWPSNRGFDYFFGEHSYVDDYFKPTHRLFRNGNVVEPHGKNWYSTDVYTDKALEFMNNGEKADDPFFLYLAYNAPHFPLQAFQEDIDKYRGRFMKGWDHFRRQRYNRMADMGIISREFDLPPRDDGAAGWHDPVPPFEDVEDKKRWDLKMASYAAQIDRMDQNIGRVLDRLEERGEMDNTLVLFLSDNGGCAEDWINRQNPKGVKPGGRECKLAYGLPWAQVSNTPFRLYKRWVHEGGISTPLIAHWPNQIKNAGRTSNEVGHVIDIMATCLDAAGAEYPQTNNGHNITPLEGKSLVPILNSRSRDGHDVIGWEHEGNRAFRKGNLKISSRDRFGREHWQLYDMENDRTEMHDLSRQYPKKKKELIKGYQKFADRTGIVDWEKLQKMKKNKS